MASKLITKSIAVATLACFMLSSVCGQALNAAVSFAGTDKARKQSFEDFVIPQSYGRITDGKCFGSRQVVINIQDLHCNPEVQKNISKILSALDERYKLKNVYVEGGYGDINTSWLCNMTSKELKSEVLDNLVAQGRLTGTEYYSAVSNRPELLKGIEDENIHKENIIRLGKILARKDIFDTQINALSRDLGFMKARYLSPRNRSFNELMEDHKTGKVPADKYYRLLSTYVRKINENPEKYNNALPISMESYPNINTFIELNRISKQINYGALSRQMQQFV